GRGDLEPTDREPEHRLALGGTRFELMPVEVDESELARNEEAGSDCEDRAREEHPEFRCHRASPRLVDPGAGWWAGTDVEDGVSSIVGPDYSSRAVPPERTPAFGCTRA